MLIEFTGFRLKDYPAIQVYQKRQQHIFLQIRRHSTNYLKLRKLFVLTTAASHWFIEHGFASAPLSILPARKAVLYNYQRNSRVLEKALS